MSPVVEAGEFSRTSLPTHLKKDARDTIEVAVMLGWMLHISSANACTIVSPDERKKYHFSSSGRTNHSLTRIKKDIIRFGDPEKVKLAFQAGSHSLLTKDKSLANAAIDLLPGLGDEGAVVDHRPELEEERKAAEAQRIENVRAAAERKRSETELSERQKAEERHVIHERPMTAKASEGRAYDSKVAIERTWSDGTTDYKCVDCDYSSEHRLSIRAHRAGSKHERTERDRNTRKAEVPLAVSYRPRQPRIEALAEVLKALMKDGITDPEELAQEALTWVHEQSNRGTGLAAESEPMTAEQTLERIRNLLDNGEREALRKRDVEIADLLERSRQMRERIEELESFVELATSLRRKDE